MKMKLVDMTKEQLVNIILRKDDIEKRLKEKVNLLEKEKEQLIEESEKMSRTRKRTRMICLMLALLCVVSSVVLACNLLK
jgi:predicted RND superfamily exporter protein